MFESQGQISYLTECDAEGYDIYRSTWMTVRVSPENMPTSVCIPFMVSSRGYGLVWDNPSKTTIDLGFNGQNVWSSEVGNRVSYFVITGRPATKFTKATDCSPE